MIKKATPIRRLPVDFDFDIEDGFMKVFISDEGIVVDVYKNHVDGEILEATYVVDLILRYAKKILPDSG